MNRLLQNHIADLLEETAGKFRVGNTNMSEDEAIDLISLFSHRRMSKDEACTYLNLSRSRFDDLVRDGKIPRGKKTRGWKELAWYEDELFLCKK